MQNAATQTSTYSYDKLNRLNTVKRADGSETQYGYDLRGNRLTQSDTRDLADETAVNYRYNLQNTLISATTEKAKTLFDYLPDGLRFKKTTGSKVTQYSYNGADQVIGDKASNGTVSSYVRGDRVLVKKDLTNQKDYYYLYNGHGDVVQMIGTDGSVVNSYQYDEWGSLTQQKETVGNEFKYAGETYDAETGLYYLKARYYDPAQGRFLNEDTVEGQINSPLTLNIYTYVSSNPLRYIDPTGNKEFEIAPDSLNHSFLPSSVVDLTSPSYWEQVRKRASSVRSKIKRLNIFSEIAEVVIKEGVKDDVSNYVWDKLTSTQRGEFIEEVLAHYDYDDYYQIGREYNGYFPVIDFVSNDGEVVSLKTIDPRNYSSNSSLSKLSDDLKELASTKIRIDGVEVPMSKRTLDIRVPQGYADSIDLNGLLKKAGEITVKVEEF